MSDGAETPHPKMTQDASAEYPGTDIQPTLSISNKEMFRVKVTTMTFCTMFPKSYLKIVNDEYVNLEFSVDRTNYSYPNDDIRYIPKQGGNITLSLKYKYNDITDIQVWTAAHFV